MGDSMSKPTQHKWCSALMGGGPIQSGIKLSLCVREGIPIPPHRHACFAHG